jgi:hypothetical protein
MTRFIAEEQRIEGDALRHAAAAAERRGSARTQIDDGEKEGGERIEAKCAEPRESKRKVRLALTFGKKRRNRDGKRRHRHDQEAPERTRPPFGLAQAPAPRRGSTRRRENKGSAIADREPTLLLTIPRRSRPRYLSANSPGLGASPIGPLSPVDP